MNTFSNILLIVDGNLQPARAINLKILTQGMTSETYS